MTPLSPAAQNIIAHSLNLSAAERKVVAESILASIAAEAPPAKPLAEIGYSDGALSGGRPPEKLFLFSLDATTVQQFRGDAIPSAVAIKSSQYHKNGKWSHTAYRLTISPSVCPCILRMELHQDGVFAGINSFADAAKRLQRSGAPATVTAERAKDFLLVHYPKAHDRIAAAEAVAGTL